MCAYGKVCVRSEERKESGDKKRARAEKRRKTSILNFKISRRLKNRTCYAYAVCVNVCITFKSMVDTLNRHFGAGCVCVCVCGCACVNVFTMRNVQFFSIQIFIK